MNAHGNIAHSPSVVRAEPGLRRNDGSRSVVIVSPYFPPSTLAGVHRARHLAKHLPQAGWTPIVLCVDESLHEERLDHGLARLVPANLENVQTKGVSAPLTPAGGSRRN